MQRQYIRQRERVFTEEMKVKFCRLVRESYSLAEAAQGVGVTLRTVQRYRREEEDFDQEVRMAKLAKPDPLKLMESAARTHWRAAAWLLERTKPETYARKRGDLASGLKVAQALRLMMETALANTPEETRTELYAHLSKTYEHALDCCFPSLGPWDRPRDPKMADTPLVFRERVKAAPVIHNYGIGTPDDWPLPAPPEATLAPGSSNRGNDATPPLSDLECTERQQEFIDGSIQLWQRERVALQASPASHAQSAAIGPRSPIAAGQRPPERPTSDSAHSPPYLNRFD